MTDSQLSVPCVRCDAPCKPHGEHHHRPGWGPVGKGMGGDPHHHLETVPLCRACHEEVHLRKWTLTVKDDIASTWQDGHVQSERAVKVIEGHKDKRYWSTEALAVGYGQAIDRAADLLHQQCEIAAQLEGRFRWHSQWDERVAEIIADWTGYSVHPRDVRKKAAIWQAFKGRWDDRKMLGSTVSLAVAESADPDEALEFANQQISEGHHKKTDVARAVHDKYGKRAARGEICECPACGARHRKKGA